MKGPYHKFTDLELSELLRKGDAGAYSEIYNRYHAALYIHAFKRLQDREECRDIVQEIFTALWQKHGETTFNSTLSGYLYMSVRNRIFDLLARKYLKQEYVVSIQRFAEEGQVTTDHMVRQHQLSAIIERELADLPARTREIFEMSRKGFLSHKEIAVVLNISEQTVKTTVNNALRVLRVRLGKIFLLFFYFLYPHELPSSSLGFECTAFIHSNLQEYERDEKRNASFRKGGLSDGINLHHPDAPPDLHQGLRSSSFGENN